MNYLDRFDLDKYKFWEKKKECNTCKILAVVGVVALLAASAYFIYKFFTPDYLEDFEDDEEFDFEDEE